MFGEYRRIRKIKVNKNSIIKHGGGPIIPWELALVRWQITEKTWN